MRASPAITSHDASKEQGRSSFHSYFKPLQHLSASKIKLVIEAKTDMQQLLQHGSIVSDFQNWLPKPSHYFNDLQTHLVRYRELQVLFGVIIYKKKKKTLHTLEAYMLPEPMLQDQSGDKLSRTPGALLWQVRSVALATLSKGQKLRNW